MRTSNHYDPGAMSSMTSDHFPSTRRIACPSKFSPALFASIAKACSGERKDEPFVYCTWTPCAFNSSTAFVIAAVAGTK